MQNFIGRIAVAREDGESNPGEQRGWGAHRGRESTAGAKEEEDAGTQCLVYTKHMNSGWTSEQMNE